MSMTATMFVARLVPPGSLLSNRLGAQVGVADPRPDYLASLWDRLANRPRPWADPEHRQPPNSGPS